ncbi:hypothetical protein E2C01_027972 [Portunus trituberculatus]|uniref:Uncharacterized protein n=1 Tax=Portunus trituberculatus TaxID=210409 RepID=A0A5B7EMM7_PORTR|nr:hypothetical protein [Portunus trituberculatus]
MAANLDCDFNNTIVFLFIPSVTLTLDLYIKTKILDGDEKEEEVEGEKDDGHQEEEEEEEEPAANHCCVFTSRTERVAHIPQVEHYCLYSPVAAQLAVGTMGER